MHNTTSSSETVLFVVVRKLAIGRYHNAITTIEAKYGNNKKKSQEPRSHQPDWHHAFHPSRRLIEKQIKKFKKKRREKLCQIQMFCVNSSIARMSLAHHLHHYYYRRTSANQFLRSHFGNALHSSESKKLGIRHQFINMWNCLRVAAATAAENVHESRNHTDLCEYRSNRHNRRWQMKIMHKII